MATTKFDICSRALTRAGANAITSFDDETGESIAAAQEYEGALAGALTRYPWRFAVKQAKLNKLSAAPDARYASAYQVPSDSLVLRAVVDSADCPIKYEIYADRVLTDSTGDLWADYTFRPDEAHFPPLFVNALVVDLAASFKQGLMDDQKAAQALREEAEKLNWPKAQNADAKSRTSKALRVSRFISVRR